MNSLYLYMMHVEYMFQLQYLIVMKCFGVKASWANENTRGLQKAVQREPPQNLELTTHILRHVPWVKNRIKDQQDPPA